MDYQEKTFYQENKPALWTAGSIVILFTAIILFFLFAPFEMINSGHRGVLIQFGQVQDEILDEGFNWISPTQNVVEMSIQTERFEATASAASKDLQSVSAQIVVNGHLDPATVNKLYQQIGSDYETKIIAPAIQESVKAATAQFTAEELITKRSEVGSIIQATLTERLAKNWITVETVSIVDFAFSPAFNEAVEQKVTAEQNALAAENKLKQVEFEAQQRIAEAEGEAKAIQIQAQAIQSQGGAEYVRLKWVEKWNGILPTHMLDGAASILLGL